MGEHDATHTYEILLIEDHPADVRAVERMLETSDLESRVSAFDTGEAAMEFLRRKGEHVDAPRPDLILLDLGLPRMSGHDVLEAIKGDEATHDIPVVIFTGSDQFEDIRRTQELAAGYVTKPFAHQELMAAILSTHIR